MTPTVQEKSVRRSALAVVAGLVVVAIGSAAAVLWPDGSGGEAPPAISESVVPPAGFEFVGVRHAAIAVPTDWGRNKLRCGIPVQDSVVSEIRYVESCQASRPAGVESVGVWQGTPGSEEASNPVTIDGVPGEQAPTTCSRDDFGKGTTCTGWVHIPSLGVMIFADSSTDAAEVDRILARIRILPDRVGVPDPFAKGERASEAAYLDKLKRAGLVARVETGGRPVESGSVRDVSPPVGTMARLGDVVTVQVF